MPIERPDDAGIHAKPTCRVPGTRPEVSHGRVIDPHQASRMTRHGESSTLPTRRVNGCGASVIGRAITGAEKPVSVNAMPTTTTSPRARRVKVTPHGDAWSEASPPGDR